MFAAVSVAIALIPFVTACRGPAKPSSTGTDTAVHAGSVAIGRGEGTEGAPPPPADAVAATVERVVDGDTIVVLVGGRHETVRLLGIDTPEKAGGPRPAECFGSQASAYTERLLPVGTSILLSRDRETRDSYGRLLAFVHRADGLFVNLALVEHGYATALFFAPNTSMQKPFTDAANEARRTWVGFWPACGAADITIEPDPPVGSG